MTLTFFIQSNRDELEVKLMLDAVREYGLKLHLNSVLSPNILAQFEPERIYMQENYGSEYIPSKSSAIALSDICKAKSIIEDFINFDDRPIIFSVTSNDMESWHHGDSISKYFVDLSEKIDLSESDFVKMILNSFHEVFESSRRTRSEMCRSVTIRTNILLKWAIADSLISEKDKSFKDSRHVDV